MNDSVFISILGALLLFSIQSYLVNKTILDSTDRNLEIERLNAAVSITQSCLNMVRAKAFDEKTITGTVTGNNFSQSLGPDGEAYPNFDDLDDYNGYKFQNIKTGYSGNYSLSIKVIYVNPATLAISNVPTGMKKISVSTFSSSLPDTIKLNYYSSY